jgi:SAM-dependent methyltransferase
VLDYDREASRYDETRGGDARADAAAAAIERLLPAGVRRLVDVACGTGIVTVRLDGPRRALGVDRSPGMIAKAVARLPGRVLVGDAAALPLAAGSVDAVVMIWLLHLVPDPERLVAEAGRVLRPGGVLVTTVDKNAGQFAPPSDVAELTRPAWQRRADRQADAHDRIVAAAARHGLHEAGVTTFDGVGQGRTPRQWARRVRDGLFPWLGRSEANELGRALETLPDPEVARPDPVYRLVALRAQDADAARTASSTVA